jgi:hypothetical protein
VAFGRDAQLYYHLGTSFIFAGRPQKTNDGPVCSSIIAGCGDAGQHAGHSLISEGLPPRAKCENRALLLTCGINAPIE